MVSVSGFHSLPWCRVRLKDCSALNHNYSNYLRTTDTLTQPLSGDENLTKVKVCKMSVEEKPKEEEVKEEPVEEPLEEEERKEPVEVKPTEKKPWWKFW